MNNLSLTGNWKLSLTKSTPQNEFLGALGRKYWERICIDKADEDFCLFHFLKPMPNGAAPVHYFEKHVTIYLNSSVLTILSKILAIEFDKVQYSHKLVCNNKEKEHAEDEKRFGQCKSRTTWETVEDREGWVIRWYIANGLLKVFHFINNGGDLQVEMVFTDKMQKVTKATKIYERNPFTPQQLDKLNNMNYKPELLLARA